VIVDHLSNAGMYRGISQELVEAFEFLKQTDFASLPDGRREIDGDRIFAIVQRYRPKSLAEVKWEAHRRYIDVQYVASGTECMGYAPLHDGMAVDTPYNAEKDYILYKAGGDLITFRPGMFAVFAPQDVHAPGLAISGDTTTDQVCKVIVKCRLAG
jgi:YhcH/YjgK/YiaL family protein